MNKPSSGGSPDLASRGTSRRAFVIGAAGAATVAVLAQGSPASADVMPATSSVAAKNGLLSPESLRKISWLDASGSHQLDLDVPTSFNVLWPSKWGRTANLTLTGDRRLVELDGSVTLQGDGWQQTVPLTISLTSDRQVSAAARFEIPKTRVAEMSLAIGFITLNPYPNDLFDDAEPFTVSLTGVVNSAQALFSSSNPYSQGDVSAWGVELYPSFSSLEIDGGYRRPISCLIVSVGPNPIPQGAQLLASADARKVSGFSIASAALGESEPTALSAVVDLDATGIALVVDLPPLAEGESITLGIDSTIFDSKPGIGDLSPAAVNLSWSQESRSFQRATGRYSVADRTPTGNAVTTGD